MTYDACAFPVHDSLSVSQFSGNHAGQGGGISVSGVTTVSIQAGTSFSGNSASVADDEASSLGGGILVSQTWASISDVSFSSNSAGRGGGIYIDCPSATACTNPTVFSGCTFSDNVALLSGGGIMWDNVEPSLQCTGSGCPGPVQSSTLLSEDPSIKALQLSIAHSMTLRSVIGPVRLQNLAPSTFSGNSAPYGGDVGSASKRVTVLVAGNITAETSGASFTQDLLVAVLDQYGAIVSTDNTTRVDASAPSTIDGSTVDITGVRSLVVQNGVANFRGIGLVADPGSSARLEVQSFYYYYYYYYFCFRCTKCPCVVRRMVD